MNRCSTTSDAKLSLAEADDQFIGNTIQAPGVTKAEWIDDYFRTLSILYNHALIGHYSGMSCHNDLVTSVTIPFPYTTYRMI
jgi:hypothetical protein